jgi:L-ascorbate metabolism protein UlaG (beta-lactamase superfamily)
MKITKFGQSCILLETKGKRILIDPGKLQFEDSLLEKDWINIDLILVTHKHGDHCYDDAVKEIVKGGKTEFYTSKEVADGHPELNPKPIKVGDKIKLGDIQIEVVKAVHGYLPHLKGGNEIFENLGYMIDDGDVVAYITSDTICFNNDYK